MARHKYWQGKQQVQESPRESQLEPPDLDDDTDDLTRPSLSLAHGGGDQLEYSPPPPPESPPPIGSTVNFVHDRATVLPAKVIGQPWGQFRQLALEVTIQVEVREKLPSISGMGDDAAAIGTRHHYRAERPDEAEELQAQQTDTLLEPTVREVSVETGISYRDAKMTHPKVRWHPQEAPGRGTAGTWHLRENNDAD